jgi:hypothetical protein
MKGNMRLTFSSSLGGVVFCHGIGCFVEPIDIWYGWIFDSTRETEEKTRKVLFAIMSSLSSQRK